MFVVIEGLDGTGKSSLAEALARSLGADYVRTPPVEYEPIRDIVHNQESPYGRFLFYLSSVVYASERISESRHNGVVVCDRFHYTSLADFFVQSAIAEPEREFWIGLASRTCEEPDVVVFCHCDREERLARISRRNADECPVARDDVGEAFEDGMLTAFRSVLDFDRTIQVDTSKSSVSELVGMLLSKPPFADLPESTEPSS